MDSTIKGENYLERLAQQIFCEESSIGDDGDLKSNMILVILHGSQVSEGSLTTSWYILCIAATCVQASGPIMGFT